MGTIEQMGEVVRCIPDGFDSSVAAYLMKVQIPVGRATQFWIN